jgi:nucleotide-binding universal stress UspA family protein
MYRTLIVPLDGSAFSERALPMATSFARSLGAQVILTRAASSLPFPAIDGADVQVQAVREAQVYLSALASRLTEQGLNIEVAVPYGDAAESILVEIGLRRADLVIMCTHGRSGLGSMARWPSRFYTAALYRFCLCTLPAMPRRWARNRHTRRSSSHWTVPRLRRQRCPTLRPWPARSAEKSCCCAQQNRPW